MPWTLLLSPYPTNNPILKYCFCPLVNISTEDIEAFVAESVDLVNVCPTIFVISPLIDSATHISFLMKFASDGFIKYSSRLITFGVSPYNTLNNILKESSVPFDS